MSDYEEEEVEECSNCSEPAEEGDDLCMDCRDQEEEEERQREEEEEREREVLEFNERVSVQRLLDALKSTNLAVITDQCCGSCSAHAGGNQCNAESLRGYVYFHEQDVENAIGSDELMVGFGAADGSDEKGEEVGRDIHKALTAAGVEVEWDFSIRRRMTVQV